MMPRGTYRRREPEPPGRYRPDTTRPAFQAALRNVLLAAGKVTGRCVTMRQWALWAEQYLSARSTNSGSHKPSERAILDTFCSDCTRGYREAMVSEGRCWRNETETAVLLLREDVRDRGR